MSSPVVIALGVGPLRWKAPITTAATPTVGDINSYDTTIGGAPLNPTMPQAMGQTAGGVMFLEKAASDISTNWVTVSCFPGETFADGTATLVLANGGQSRLLQIVNVDGVMQFKVIGGLGTPDLLSVATAQSALPMIIALG